VAGALEEVRAVRNVPQTNDRGVGLTKASRRLVILVVFGLLVASCGDDTTAPAADASTTTGALASTEDSTTTVAPATTAPATTAPTTTEPTTTTFRLPPPPAEGSPSPAPWGSGCTPPGDTLPDGDWFGFLEGLEVEAEPRIVFDLSCYFDGDDAELAATEDAYPHLPLEFTPYIRNQNPKVFDVPVSATATVEDHNLGGTVPFLDWVAAVSSDSGCSASSGFAACPIWVRIDDGAAVLLYGILMEWAGDDRGS
jgi:hypothetical protein